MRPPRVVLAVVIVVVLSGCLGFGGPPPSDPGAEAVVDDAADAASEVDTYRFDGDIRIVASSDGETRRVSVNHVGAVNRSTQRLWSNTTFKGDVRRTFVVGNQAYMECQSPWGWGVENVSEDGETEWRSTDPLGRQVDLLQSSPVYWAGNETIDGVEVHVIEARPSEETLREYGDRRRGSVFGPEIEDATFTAYVVKDSGRIVKTVLDFTVTGDGANADAHMTTRFTDYGADVTVTVPDEAVTHPREFGCPGS